MKAKSFFKGPGIWIVVVVGLLLLAFATLAPGGSTRIDTKDGPRAPSQSGKVEQAKIFDAENRVDLVLKDNLVTWTARTRARTFSSSSSRIVVRTW